MSHLFSKPYIGSLDLCVLCVSVVPFTPSPAGLYLRIHFTHQAWESHNCFVFVGMPRHREDDCPK
ncbi:hypothetical protein [Microcystis sp. BLCC-F210]|uniref:hypothetical protein n=1 Tax=Microcystis sp. BLCC-F210 TaxID=3342751 RepID=UPI0035C89D6A